MWRYWLKKEKKKKVCALIQAASMALTMVLQRIGKIRSVPTIIETVSGSQKPLCSVLPKKELTNNQGSKP